MADDIYKSLRYFLIYGRILGILPLYGLKQHNCKRLYFRRKSFASFTSLLIILTLGVNGAVASFRVIRVGKGSVYKVFGTSLTAAFYTLGAFKMWNNVALNIHSGDVNLTRDVSLIAFIFPAVNALGDILSQLKVFGIDPIGSKEYNEQPGNMTTGLELYYVRSHKYFAEFIPFNPILTIFLFLQRQINDNSWAFSDIFICVIARSLNYKLKAYLKQVNTERENDDESKDKTKDRKDELSQEPISSITVSKTIMNWEQICRDYEMLGELVGGFRDVLSPLVFACYGANIFFLSFQIWAIPTKNRFSINFIATFWSALTHSMRMIFLNVQAARIHSNGQTLGKLILQKCPLEFFPLKTSKIERILERKEMGLTGLGCFTITNNLLLHVVGVIFTLEVLLIQGQLKV